MSLAKQNLPAVCPKGGCDAAYEVTAQHVGSAVLLIWVDISSYVCLSVMILTCAHL